MYTYRASDAKREFGELLLKSQSGPVGVTRNGKPVAVILSVHEYEGLLAAKEQQLTAAIKEGVADYKADKVSSAESVYSRMRNRLSGTSES